MEFPKEHFENRQKHNAYAAKYREKNRDKTRAYDRALYAKRKGSPARVQLRHGMTNTVEYSMWSHTKSRANLTGIPFNLELSDIVIPERCPVLGIELQASSRGKHGASPNSPSLDRIVPKLGYVKGNVRIISFRANAIKYNATAAELRLVADYAEKVEREFNQ